MRLLNVYIVNTLYAICKKIVSYSHKRTRSNAIDCHSAIFRLWSSCYILFSKLPSIAFSLLLTVDRKRFVYHHNWFNSTHGIYTVYTNLQHETKDQAPGRAIDLYPQFALNRIVSYQSTGFEFCVSNIYRIEFIRFKSQKSLVGFLTDFKYRFVNFSQHLLF